MSDELVRVDNDDPRRCQSSHGCMFKSVDGEKFCRIHLPRLKSKTSMYKTIFRDRLDEIKQNPSFKKLAEEVALCRLLIEKKLETIETDLDLLRHAPQIANLTDQVQKLLLTSCKIDEMTKNLVDKDTLLNIADKMINVIDANIEDKSILEKISNELTTILQEIE